MGQFYFIFYFMNKQNLLIIKKMRSQPATKYKGVYKDRELTCTNRKKLTTEK